MKKIVIVIIFNIILFAKEVNLYEKIKETNNQIILTLIKIKTSLISKTNSLLPSYLNFEKETSTFKYKISFDTNNPKINQSIGINLKLPAFETSKNVIENSNKKIPQTYTIKLIIRPIIKLNKPPFVRVKLLQKDNNIFSNLYIFDYYIDKKWELKDEYKISYKKFSTNIYLHTSKEELNNFDYGYGAYYVINYQKNLYIIGYQNSGISNKKPIISNHKIFITYSTYILKSKRTTFSVTPYITRYKNNSFVTKLGIYTSLQYQF